MSILCDGMQDRSVLLARTPLLGPSPHAVDFVISGRHVAALFGCDWRRRDWAAGCGWTR